MTDSTSTTAVPRTLEAAFKEIEWLKAENVALRTLSAEQAEQIRIMKLREYGRSSEKRLSGEDIRQGQLFDEAELLSSPPEEPPVMETVKVRNTTYQRRKPGRRKIADTLTRVDVVADLSEDKKKVDDGYELVKIGEDVSEQVHEVPQKYIVIKTIRPKYVKRPIESARIRNEGQSQTTILSAPLPPRMLPRSIATPSACPCPDRQVLRRPAVLPAGENLCPARIDHKQAGHGQLDHCRIQTTGKLHRLVVESVA